MSKPPKLDLKSIVAAATPQRPSGAEVVRLEPVLPKAAPSGKGTLKERARQLSVYLEPPVYDQLREIAFAERTKIHSLMLESLDLLFRQRGALSIKQLTDEAPRS